MNPFDIVAILLVLVAVIAGVKTGALPQVGGISGALGGLLLAINGAPWVLEHTTSLEPIPRALAVIGVLLGAIVIGEAIGSALGRAAADRMGDVLGSLDRVAGGLVGAAQAVLIVWLAGGLLAAGPFPTLARQASTSTAVRLTDRFLPPATEVIGDIAAALDSSGLPAVFVGLEPIPLEPVDTPPATLAKKIADQAISGTARVTTAACKIQISGTAFLFARDYLVTNAHVVAGGTSITVELGDKMLNAVPVLFDPELDVAVLYVRGLGGTVLRFATASPDRGTQGAALGYTGGGPLMILPAAVAGEYPATGRDIYGTTKVTRQILELRAEVNPGDSGGPLVLGDGTVGGLVFAESKTDPSVGYALTPASIAARIAPAVGRTSKVDTGACVR